MGKKIIHLTEQEFIRIVKSTINEMVDEIGGATHSVIYNAGKAAQDRQLKGEPSPNPRKNNIDTIQQASRLSISGSDSLISPFKQKYLFHGQDLRGVACLVVFQLDELYEQTPIKVILKGTVWFDNQQLSGNRLIVDMSDRTVFYSYRNKSPKYRLQIDPSNKDMWNALLNEIQKSLDNRN